MKIVCVLCFAPVPDYSITLPRTRVCNKQLADPYNSPTLSAHNTYFQ
jgi:hypothetical protein